MDKIIFTAPAILNTLSLTKDGGVRLGFVTQELSEKERILIQRFYNSYGHLLFSENHLQTKDIPKEQPEDKTKTPSKRLRAVLYCYWQQTNGKGDFEVFYREHMEKLINIVKGKLDV